MDGAEISAVNDTMETVGDLVARERRSTEPAVYAAARDRTYSYFDLCNTAAKAGNVLRHVGVRPGDRVWIEPRPEPEPWLTFLGAAQLGAVVRFAGPHDTGGAHLGTVGQRPGDGGGDGEIARDENGDRAADTREADGAGGDARTPDPPAAVVVHVAAEPAASVAPGTSLVAYGGEPSGAETTHWESQAWSENPAAPPAPVGPGDPVLVGPPGDGTTYDHGRLLSAARDVGERANADEETTIVLRASPADPRAVAGALAAPLAGGTLALPDGDRPVDRDLQVTVGDADGDHVTLDGVEL